MKLAGEISISRCSDNTIHIELIDSDSRERFVTAIISPETLGNAITGLGFQPAELSFGNLTRVGKRRESKTVSVLFNHEFGLSRDENMKRAKEILKQFEVDGWSGDIDDMFNPHKSGGGGMQRVGFIRWV